MFVTLRCGFQRTLLKKNSIRLSLNDLFVKQIEPCDEKRILYNGTKFNLNLAFDHIEKK